MEPHTSFGGLLLLAVRHQVSVVVVTQTLLVAGVTAGVTTYATAQRIDERMKEVIQEIKEIQREHSALRERLTRMETEIGVTVRNGIRPDRN